MYIARWHLTARIGHRDATAELLRKWQTDVGERIGWRASSVRLTSGLIGVNQACFELEVRIDSLSDLEEAWADMAKHPYHQQYSKELEGHLEAGSNVWQVLKVIENNLAS